jgi:hypothetical protein
MTGSELETKNSKLEAGLIVRLGSEVEIVHFEDAIN